MAGPGPATRTSRWCSTPTTPGRPTRCCSRAPRYTSPIRSRPDGWTAALAATLDLPAGDYWYGFIVDNNSARYYYSGSDNLGVYGDDTYSDGPEATFTDDTSGVLAYYAISAHFDYYTIKPMSCAWAIEFAATFATPATTGEPVISAPTASENLPAGDNTATATFTHPTAADIAYEWEVDTDNPPDAGTNYQQIITGLNDSGDAVSVTLAALTADTWYLRVRAWDTYSTGAYSTWSRHPHLLRVRGALPAWPARRYRKPSWGRPTRST